MLKLLIVDDEADIREFAKNYFRKRAIEVTTADNGREALKCMERQPFDLILLDVRMEEMSGIDVLRALDQKKIHLKIIMVTGVEDEETMQEAKRLGVFAYIHKPLVLDELEKIVLAQLNS